MANAPIRDEENAPIRDDKFARQSFTLRRMAPWQLWSISIASVVVVVAAVIYALNL